MSAKLGRTGAILVTMLLCASYASARTFGPTEPDSVSCPYGDVDGNMATTSNEAFNAWVGRYRSPQEDWSWTSTRARAELRYMRSIPLAGSNLPVRIGTTFTIANGRVTRIERESGV